MDRNLDRVFFRVKNEETGEFENKCFSDLTPEQQDEMMNGKGEEWLKNMCKILAKTIKDIGDQFDILCE
jgi:hypothetical protein